MGNTFFIIDPDGHSIAVPLVNSHLSSRGINIHNYRKVVTPTIPTHYLPMNRMKTTAPLLKYIVHFDKHPNHQL